MTFSWTAWIPIPKWPKLWVDPCYDPFRIPAPNPTNATNRCRLKPLTPEMPEITLLLVCPQQRLALQVVWRSRPRFQLPNPSSQTRLPTQAPATLVTTPGQAKKIIHIHPPDSFTPAYLLGLIYGFYVVRGLWGDRLCGERHSCFSRLIVIEEEPCSRLSGSTRSIWGCEQREPVSQVCGPKLLCVVRSR